MLKPNRGTNRVTGDRRGALPNAADVDGTCMLQRSYTRDNAASLRAGTIAKSASVTPRSTAGSARIPRLISE
jgi:hypothetical protein